MALVFCELWSELPSGPEDVSEASLEETFVALGLATRSPSLARTLRFAMALAEERHPPPVLITGETGAGKSELAKAMHRHSVEHGRRKGELVDKNGCEFNGDIGLSLLIGAARGVASGVAERAGYVQKASGGTLVIDEIGEMEECGQVCLLKVVEDSTVCRVGSTKAEVVDPWVIAVTNRDIEAEIAAGHFRRDLKERFDVRIELPPLSERPMDVPVLVDHFCAQLNLVIDPDARELIEKAAMEQTPRWIRNTLLSSRRLPSRRITVDSVRFATVAAEPPRRLPLQAEVTRLADAVEAGVKMLAGLVEHLRGGGVPATKPGATVQPLPPSPPSTPPPPPASRRSDLPPFSRRVLELLEGNSGNRTWVARILGIPRQRVHRIIARARAAGVQVAAALRGRPTSELAMQFRAALG